MLRIGDFSRLTQVSIKTLRYYDEIGLFKPAEIDPFTGYRYYTLEQVPRLHRILALRDLKFSLEQIAHLVDDGLNPDELHGLLRLKMMELRQEIEDAQARLARLDMRLKQIERGDKMPDYEIVMRRVDAQRVLSLRRVAPTLADVQRLFEQARAAARQQQVKRQGAWMILYHHAGYRDADLDIEVAVPVDAPVDSAVVLLDGSQMILRTIPAIASAATAVLHGSYDQLGEVYAALDTYIHQHGQNYLGPAREIYMRGAHDTGDPSEYFTEVQYPVGEFTGEVRIDGVGLPGDWGEGLPLPLSRRARTALEWAKAGATDAQQNEVGPEHLLIGLLREGESLAGQVLRGFGLSIEDLRAALHPGDAPPTAPAVSDAARRAVADAVAEARALGHDYIGTEHLLLGLLRQDDADVTRLLANGGVSIDQTRAAVLRALKP